MGTASFVNLSPCSASVVLSTWANNFSILYISFPTYNKGIEPFVKSFLALIIQWFCFKHSWYDQEVKRWPIFMSECFKMYQDDYFFIVYNYDLYPIWVVIAKNIFCILLEFRSTLSHKITFLILCYCLVCIAEYMNPVCCKPA